jgi:hypothetical protein
VNLEGLRGELDAALQRGETTQVRQAHHDELDEALVIGSAPIPAAREPLLSMYHWSATIVFPQCPSTRSESMTTSENTLPEGDTLPEKCRSHETSHRCSIHDRTATDDANLCVDEIRVNT